MNSVPVFVDADGFPPAATDHFHDSRMLRPMDVCERTTLSPTHIRRLQGQGRFPPYAGIGWRARGLPEHILDVFLAERMAARAGLPPLGFRPLLPLWGYSPEVVPERRGIRLFTRDEVIARVGLGKSTIYRLIPHGLFPAPVSLGPHAARWVAYEVDTWIASCSPVPVLPAHSDWAVSALESVQ